MKCKGNNKSKKQKLSLKYNIQKRQREHKRRVKKEATKLGMKKRVKKDPGIPNSWPFKAEMLADIERLKEKKEAEIAKKRAEQKTKGVKEKKQMLKESSEAHRDKEVERRKKREEQVEMSQLDSLRRLLLKADVLLQVLDARDPLGCRCLELEVWAKENGKRLVFVLSKCDLVTPQQAAQWLQVLGQVGPAVSVQVEAGREGVAELVRMLGHSTSSASGSSAQAPTLSGVAAATAVAILGYPGTGKKTLNKAIRREVQGCSWLLEALGRLRPAEDPEGEAAVLAEFHHAVRGILPKSSEKRLPVVTLLLTRTEPQVLMRRFRVPAFADAEGLLKAWASDRKLQNKKGKDLTVEAAAQRFVSELATAPAASCVPPATPLEGADSMWASHAASRAALESMMKAQIELFGGRDSVSCAAAGGLALTSAGSGPDIMLKELMEGEEAEGEDGEEVDMDDDDEEGGEGEGEEEEDFEDDMEADE